MKNLNKQLINQMNLSHPAIFLLHEIQKKKTSKSSWDLIVFFSHKPFTNYDLFDRAFEDMIDKIMEEMNPMRRNAADTYAIMQNSLTFKW